MVYEISPSDFAHHVRHATSWNDVGKRCGYKADSFGAIINASIIKHIKQQIHNMRLSTEHFHTHNRVPDDVLIKIVRESNSWNKVRNKIKSITGIYTNRTDIEPLIKDLDLDISHWKNMKKYKTYQRCTKIDVIDDETLKTFLHNSINWSEMMISCGYNSWNQKCKAFISNRLDVLGLNTNHFHENKIPDEEVFVKDSQFTSSWLLKTRLLRNFNRIYECNACKNVNFTMRDGVLMWNDQEITLQLEHINGVNNDNRPENLVFLCANCHSQTSTFCGGNNPKHKLMQKWLEDGKEYAREALHRC